VCSGITDDASYAEARDILVDMGEYFQVQDDYLDCYGAPEVIGKVCISVCNRACCRMCRVSCLVSRVSCLVSRVSCLVSRVSCLVSRVSCLGRGRGRGRGSVLCVVRVCAAASLRLSCACVQIGTDIQDNKCGWLIVQALNIANAEQKALLQANYGRHDDECVKRVKDLYRELNLEKVPCCVCLAAVLPRACTAVDDECAAPRLQVFRDYEEASYQSLRKRIDSVSHSTPAAVFEGLLSKIYKRSM
jgi:hypothetical protein